MNISLAATVLANTHKPIYNVCLAYICSLNFAISVPFNEPFRRIQLRADVNPQHTN